MRNKLDEMRALKVGEKIIFSKTIGESDIYLFAGITGDFSSNHINEEYMKSTKYKQRIAHGVLLVGFMSTASTLMGKRHRKLCPEVVRVSYGYEHVRFIKPVFIGDTITIEYITSSIDEKEYKIFSDIKCVNQKNELVAVSTHIIKVV